MIFPVASLKHLAFSPRSLLLVLDVCEDLRSVGSQMMSMVQLCFSAVDMYRDALLKLIKQFDHQSASAKWSDQIMVKVYDVVGRMMKENLGRTVPPASVDALLFPTIFEELVNLSGLRFQQEQGREQLKWWNTSCIIRWHKDLRTSLEQDLKRSHTTTRENTTR